MLFEIIPYFLLSNSGCAEFTPDQFHSQEVLRVLIEDEFYRVFRIDTKFLGLQIKNLLLHPVIKKCTDAILADLTVIHIRYVLLKLFHCEFRPIYGHKDIFFLWRAIEKKHKRQKAYKILHFSSFNNRGKTASLTSGLYFSRNMLKRSFRKFCTSPSLNLTVAIE